MDTDWSAKYPRKDILRHEVRAMVEVIRAVLLTEVGESRIHGIYAKGSATRAWDTVIDYVPEISDVDIHVWLVDEPSAQPVLQDLDVALAIQADLERRYRKRFTRRCMCQDLKSCSSIHWQKILPTSLRRLM